MDNPILLLIDIQPEFSAAKRIIKPVLKEVYKAIQNQRTIFCLEFGPVPTYAKIKKLLKSYPLTCNLQKWDDDGSASVLYEMVRHRFDHFRVCGVNSDICVLDTVLGIRKKSNIPIVIVRKACATYNSSWSWDKFPRLENVYFD